MPVLAEFDLSTPILQEVTERTPGAEIRLAGHCVNEAGEFCLRYWVASVDPEEIEAALDAERTVASYDCLAEEDGRFFYQAYLSDFGREVSIAPLLGEYGGELLDGYWTGSAWKLRLRFPNESLFREFVDACGARDNVSLALGMVYREESYDDADFGLTPSQREALTVALDHGYFEVPRRTTLVEIADRLGISDRAVSERLRRGQELVLRRTLGDDDAPESAG